MPGHIHDPLADVETIRQLLSGYGTGFPFLKEAIQNAHDAGATKVSFRWHCGLGNKVNHPLLKGPALLVLNDGPFDKEGRRGIEMIGLSNRAADTERIGRFGLGIKSLFHICEGFFYFESTGDKDLRSFLTPWHAETEERTLYHKDWWRVTNEDWKAMQQIAKAEKMDKFFALWIPLRQQAHCKELLPLRKEWPGNSTESCPKTLDDAFRHRNPSVAETVIFLENIRSVSLPGGQDGAKISRAENEGNPMRVGDHTVFWKTIANDRHPLVSELQLTEYWPTVTDRRTASQCPDKAAWKGGVALSFGQPRGQAKLRLFWAVFLPVGNAPAFECDLPGFNEDVHIFIHGYFFPNRDRTEISGAGDGFAGAGRDSEEALKLLWNRELCYRKEGILPLVLPLLDEVVRQRKLKDGQIRSLVGGIAESPWFGHYRAAVCQTHAFGKVLTGAGWKWQLRDAIGQALLVPTTAGVEAETVLRKLFPKPPSDRSIMPDAAPRLQSINGNSEWNATDFSWFFGSLDIRHVASDGDVASFLRSLLKRFANLAAANHRAWENLCIWSIRSLVTTCGLKSRRDVAVHSGRGRLFTGGDQRLRQRLLSACPDVDAWFVEGEVPPGIQAATFNLDSVAELVVAERNFAGVEDRGKLIETLLPSVQTEVVRNAIRLLLHVCPAHKDLTCHLIFKIADVGDGTGWNQVFQTVLKHRRENWRLLDHGFAGGINEHQRETLSLDVAGPEAFSIFCHEIGDQVGELPLSGHHDFLLQKLREGTHYDPEADNKLLRQLKIHRLGNNNFTAITGNVWLEPEAEFLPPATFQELWQTLSAAASICKRSNIREVAERQNEVFKPRVLDANGIIRLACAQNDAAGYAPIILHYLGRIGNPQRETRDVLLQTAWLPRRKGRAVRLDDLLWIEGAEAQLEGLKRHRKPESTAVLRSEIAIDFGEFEGAWNTLVRVNPRLVKQGEDAVELLRNAFDTPALHIGLSEAQDWTSWLRAIESCDADISLAVALIRALWPVQEAPDTQSRRGQAMPVIEVFRHKWTEDYANRYDKVLASLRQRHEETREPDKAIVKNAFLVYLVEAKKAGRWTEVYLLGTEFRLLSRTGKWVGVGNLAVDVPGICASCILDQDTAKALELKPSDQRLRSALATGIAVPEAETDKELQKLLKAYARKFGEVISRREWGLFFAQLGPNVRELAEEFLSDAGNVDRIRDDLVGPTPSEVRTVLVRCKYSCAVEEGDMVELRAVNGKTFKAARDLRDIPLVIPKPQGGRDANGRGNVHFEFRNQEGDSFEVHFQLRSPKWLVKNLSPSELRDCLRRTIEIHQSEVLHAEPRFKARLPKLIESMRTAEPLDLLIAQEEMLEHVPQQLQQLAFRTIPDSLLDKGVGLVRKARSLQAEARAERAAERGNPSQAEEESRQLEKEGHSVLREVLSSDDITCGQLAAAMLQRIRDEQYQKSSIPFEIFQNADDALKEAAAEFERSSIPSLFVAEFVGGRTRFAHWGRPINQVCGVDPAVDVRYRRDLVKMLILHGSDKSGRDPTGVTGKFGLGFKSVFLASSQPRVLSGKLAITIRAAFWPVRLDESDRVEISNWAREQIATDAVATVVEMPADTRVEDDSTQVYRRFCELALYLPVLAGRIRNVRIRMGEDCQQHSWCPTAVVELGHGRKLAVGPVAGGQLLQFYGGNVSWLFGWTPDRLLPMPNVPTIWATAPLHATPSLGFIVNGPFEPDPGRTELGRGQGAQAVNERIFSEAAALLADCLKVIAESGFPDVLAVEPPRFWQSVWNLFSKLPTVSADRPQYSQDMLVRAVWPADLHTGYAAIVEAHRVIPTGLPGEWDTLTSLNAIRFYTTGFLESKPGKSLLSAIGQTLGTLDAQLRVRPAELVSAATHASLAKHVPKDRNGAEQIALPFILRRLIGRANHLSPQVCGLLSEHLAANLFEAGEGAGAYDWPRNEKEGVREMLTELEFESAAGTWFKAASLLTDFGSDNETGRHAFAPLENRLNAAYGSSGGEGFFKLCRERPDIRSADLHRWIMEALENGEEERIGAGLRFLASPKDEMAIDVARLLNAKARRELIDSDLFQGLSMDDQNRVRGAFQLADGEDARREGRVIVQNEKEHIWPPDEEEDEPIPEQLISVQDIMNAWQGNEQRAIEQFTASGIYRELVFPNVENTSDLGALLRNANSIPGKQHWYRLLCLGCSMSIPLGRNPASRIIPFWRDRLNDEFWAVTIPQTPDEAKTTGFDQRLDSFFEDIIHRSFRSENASGEDADFWRRVFYDFRKMHFYVFKNDLPAVLLQLANANNVGGSALISFLRSGLIPTAMRTSDAQSWTGVIGQSMSAPLLFVMRELRRLNVIPPDRFESACFYMNNPARRVAYRLGWITEEERRNYSFGNLVALSESIFDRFRKCEHAQELLPYFDLPLQWYAAKPAR